MSLFGLCQEDKHILEALQTLLQRTQTIMTTLQDIVQEVSQQRTVVESAVALLNGISAQLKAALANGADPAVIQQISDNLTASTNELATAVAANTVAPGNPPPPAPQVAQQAANNTETQAQPAATSGQPVNLS